MATTEYNQDQSGLRSELDEPRRTTENDVEDTGFDAPQQEKNSDFPSEQGDGGYGGESGQEQPHHKIHTDDEPLPKPSTGTYDDESGAAAGQEEPRDEQVMPSGTGSGYGDESAPQSTEKYQDYRSEEPRGTDDETPDTQPRSFGEDKTSGGYSDPSSAFAGAPVDRQMQEPGYGQDTQTPEPMGATPDSPPPKKEGLVQKLKDKLPGHHKSSAPASMDDDIPTDTGTPKKGLVTKIKEKLPGHHPTTEPDASNIKRTMKWAPS